MKLFFFLFVKFENVFVKYVIYLYFDLFLKEFELDKFVIEKK